MSSLAALLLLPLSLLAVYHSTTITAEARQIASTAGAELPLRKRSAGSVSGLSASNRMALASLLKRSRSFEEALRAPPQDDLFVPSLAKREDEWIWMPAHGYIPMPKDESSNNGDEQDNGIGNLLRYG